LIRSVYWVLWFDIDSYQDSLIKWWYPQLRSMIDSYQHSLIKGWYPQLRTSTWVLRFNTMDSYQHFWSKDGTHNCVLVFIIYNFQKKNLWGVIRVKKQSFFKTITGYSSQTYSTSDFTIFFGSHVCFLCSQRTNPMFYTLFNDDGTLSYIYFFLDFFRVQNKFFFQKKKKATYYIVKCLHNAS